MASTITQDVLEVVYFYGKQISFSNRVPLVHPKLRPDIRLSDVGKSTRDQDLMAWASEPMDINSWDRLW